METGSAFEGMGAAREVSYAVLAEAAIIAAVLALSVHTRQRVAGHHARRRRRARARRCWRRDCSPCCWRKIAACRSTIPNTHLELTMIHEVMVLDHSGPPLAAILHGASVKLLLVCRAAGPRRCCRLANCLRSPAAGALAASVFCR